MRIVDQFIDEVAREAVTTRRVLERVPENKLSWRPHAKSMTLGELALHTATTPGMVSELLRPLVLDMPAFTNPEAKSSKELLAALDQSVATATAALNGWDDAAVMAEWKLTAGG